MYMGLPPDAGNLVGLILAPLLALAWLFVGPVLFGLAVYSFVRRPNMRETELDRRSRLKALFWSGVVTLAGIVLIVNAL
jgi:hypothetical protein